MPTRRTVLTLMTGTPIFAPMLARGESLPVGASTIGVADARGATSAPLRVFVHRPAAWKADSRVVLVMHGINRDADRYAASWTPLAEQHGFLLVVPEFSQAKFPRSAYYNFGGIQDEDGRFRPRSEWTFGVIDTVFETVRRLAGASRESFSLYGHSAGAQFVHRFIMFHASPRLEMAVSANAGWYTLPSFEESFPYGLKGVADGDADLAALLKRQLVLQLGDLDIDPHHKNLRRNEEADRQGHFRFARGQFMMATAREQAKRLGVPLAWKVHVTPGVAHSDSGMSKDAARLLFS